jgi:pimeloyl-ACP methyl ester carboxylesterase
VARAEELRITAGDARLAATLALPDGPSPYAVEQRYPNVLLLPSWLPRDRDGRPDVHAHAGWFANGGAPGLLGRLAGALAAAGVASVRFDPRGCGASDGQWEAVDLFTRIDDARDALAAMRTHPALDLRRTGLVGHGEGAIPAMSVAIADPAVSALTLIGPSARSWRDVLRRGVAMRGARPLERRHPIVAALDRASEEIIERAERHEPSMPLRLTDMTLLQLGLRGAEQAIHTPGLALASMLHRSVTLVHGADDAWSDPDESALLEAALEEAGNRPSRRIVPGAGHDLSEASDAVIGELADDLAARIQPRDLPPVLLAIEQMR